MGWKHFFWVLGFSGWSFSTYAQDFSRFFLDTADQQTANGILLEANGKIWLGGTKLPIGGNDLKAWLYRINANGEVLQRFSFPALGSQTWVGMGWAGEGKLAAVIGQRLPTAITENWMAILDSTGIISFQKIDGADQAILDHISYDGEGHFYLCGFRGNPGPTGNNAWVGKVKAPGHIRWIFEETYSANDHAAQSKLGPGNRLYVAGTVANQGYNPFAACLDTAGNLVWDLIIPTGWNDGGRSLDFDSQGRMWMVGESSTWLGPEFDTEISIISTSTGQLEWMQWLGAPGQEAAFAIQKGKANHLWVGGYSNASTGSSGPVSPFLMKLNENGNSLGEAFWPQMAPSPVYDLKVVNDSIFYFCGLSNDRAFLFKRIQPTLSNVFVVSNEVNLDVEKIKGYRYQPETKQLLWQNQKFEPKNLKIRDVLGRLVKETNQNLQHFTLPALPMGIYWAEVELENENKPWRMRFIHQK